MNIKQLSILIIGLWLTILPIAAQQKQRFSVTSFTLDQSTTTSEREDSDGYPMALLKVTSNDPESLEEYAFNFGNQYSVVDSRDHGDELWLFVQRNAKRVRITRGNTVVDYDLKPMIEAGKVYNMYIKGPERIMRFQMTRFEITPKMAGATIFIKGSDGGEQLLGTTDASGSAAKNLRHDRYTYRVIADQYKESQGEFTLNDENSTHTERVALLPNFAEVTLTVDADADIYINNEKRESRTWTGRLSAGDYQIECRQANHRPSHKIITVVENDNRTFTLDKPTPIVGKMSVNSSPLDAKITIDGQDYGTTPRNFDFIIGQHQVVVSKPNHQPYSQTVEVKEGQTVEVEATLKSQGRITIASTPSGATLCIDGKQVGTTPYSAEMSSGEYRIKLTKDKCKPFDKRVHLDVSSPNVSYSLSRQYFKPTGGYVSLGFSAGGQMGPVAAVGAYIKNVNIEVFGCYGIGSETVYGLSLEGKDPTQGKLSPIIAGGKLGYGIEAAGRVRITPQVGFGIVMAGSDVADVSASFACIDVVAEYAIHPSFSLFAAPGYRFAVQKGDAFNSVSAMSSKVKGWATGFDISCGIRVNF